MHDEGLLRKDENYLGRTKVRRKRIRFAGRKHGRELITRDKSKAMLGAARSAEGDEKSQVKRGTRRHGARIAASMSMVFPARALVLLHWGSSGSLEFGSTVRCPAHTWP